MIPFWKRSEVFMGFDIDKLADVRDALTNANIPYIQRASGHKTRSFIGSAGENLTFSSLYYIYVHKDDLGRAHAALRSSLKR